MTDGLSDEQCDATCLRVSEILQEALSGSNQAYRFDGFIRWGLVEHDILDVIRAAGRAAGAGVPVAWIASRPGRQVLHFAKLDGWDVQAVAFDAAPRAGAQYQPAATPRPESDVTPYPTMDITGPQGAGGSAADPSDAELIARRRVALGPLVIYESTDGNTTRKVLADDALRLQRVIRAAAIDAALAGEDGDGQ